MNVELLAHTQLSKKFKSKLKELFKEKLTDKVTDGQIVSLTAIRNCYSYHKPTEIVPKEYNRYFNRKAKDGEKGSDADRLFRQIFRSKHRDTLEHLSFTFAIEEVSRTLLAQLTRHRIGFSFSVESQRYTRMGINDKYGGAKFYIPEELKNKEEVVMAIYEEALSHAQKAYDELRNNGVSPQESREVLPNATLTNIVMTCNLRSLLDFYSKRKPGRGAQTEIALLSNELKSRVVEVEPWTEQFFEEV